MSQSTYKPSTTKPPGKDAAGKKKKPAIPKLLTARIVNHKAIDGQAKTVIAIAAGSDRGVVSGNEGKVTTGALRERDFAITVVEAGISFAPVKENWDHIHNEDGTAMVEIMATGTPE